ncbi:divergent polysaccharide deacetylase family protein [uncultured Pseudodesulfovibrio sp.]|uniref:divergent polysaccharide deacetylase family protein n=1 Tax=uncultured Pseudodesulfovibrio sp. TaxID=2035858 RepID=UPI0029C9211C|nr:divergent polysaccharide deacetylase family protein [uncultured Pseudodesulfovibrio sp.]
MDDHPSEQTDNKTGLDGFLQRIYRPGPLVFLFTIAFLALISLGYFLITEETPPPSVLASAPTPDAPTTLIPVKSPPPEKEYEEETTEMEDHVKQADFAILETLRELDVSLKDLDLVDVELRQHQDHNYHYQVLQLPRVKDRNNFLLTLRKNIFERLPAAILLDNGDNEAIIQIDGLPTHRLLLENTPQIIARPEAKRSKLAIVIDDIGENHAVLKGLLALDLPLTFAVWPHASHTEESVTLINRNKRDLIVHFPMEPLGYPKVKPGEDALFVDMTTAQIERQIVVNLKRIPQAIGVNNHMGSRFTASSPGMMTALTEFKRRGLFFLDSMTSAKSVGSQTAQSVGIPFYKRDIFLDNVKDVNAIIHQLKKTERVAIRQGTAIAIGHPYKETLAALKQWQADRNSSVQIISLSRISPE